MSRYRSKAMCQGAGNANVVSACIWAQHGTVVLLAGWSQHVHSPTHQVFASVIPELPSDLPHIAAELLPQLNSWTSEPPPDLAYLDLASAASAATLHMQLMLN